MKNAFILTVTVGLALLIVLGIFLVSEMQDRRSRQVQNQQLTQRLAVLEEQVFRLGEATNALARDLVEARQIAASNALLAASLAQAENRAGGISTNPPKLQPYPVQVYLGQQPIGQGWTIPTNVRRDPKSGRVSFEPVIRLPETVRGSFTTYVTNTVERQVAVPSPPVIEREVYVDRRWPWWGPAAVAVPAVHYGNRPARPVDPGYSRPVLRPSSGAPWTPVSVPPRPAPSRGIHVPPQRGDPGIFVPPGLR